jgi:hypothetical protein
MTKKEYVITVGEASDKTPVASAFGSGYNLEFPTQNSLQEYEAAEEALNMHTYWKIRERYGIWASNQARYVTSYSDLNDWDNPQMENRCIALYGPRGFRLMEFLKCEMKTTVLHRVIRWQSSARVGQFLSLKKSEVVLWAACGEATWREIERCQSLYRERFGLKFDFHKFIEISVPSETRQVLDEIGIDSIERFMRLQVDMTKAYPVSAWRHVSAAQNRYKDLYGDHSSVPRKEKEAKANGRGARASY